MFIAYNSVAGSCRRIKKLEEASKVKRFLGRRFLKEGHYSSRSFLYRDCIKHKEFCTVKICNNVCVCVCVCVCVPISPVLLLSPSFNFQVCSQNCEERRLASLCLSLCLSVCLSVHPPEITWLPINGLSRRFIHTNSCSLKAVCGSYSTAALRHIVLLPE